MKKVLIGVAMMFSLISYSFAQTTTTKANTQTKQKTVTTAKATQAKPTQETTKKKVVTTNHVATTNGAQLKKDGTPDQRYKANKKGK